jgi:hypothetical protein
MSNLLSNVIPKNIIDENKNEFENLVNFIQLLSSNSSDNMDNNDRIYEINIKSVNSSIIYSFWNVNKSVLQNMSKEQLYKWNKILGITIYINNENYSERVHTIKNRSSLSRSVLNDNYTNEKKMVISTRIVLNDKMIHGRPSIPQRMKLSSKL